MVTIWSSFVEQVIRPQAQWHAVWTASSSSLVGRRHLLFQQMILGSDGSDGSSRTSLKGFARLTVAAAAAAEAMDADEESAKRSQKVHQVTWKSRSLSDPIQLPRYSDSHSHDSEEEDACASLDLRIFDLADHFCLVCVVACLGWASA